MELVFVHLFNREPFAESRRNIVYSSAILGFVIWYQLVLVARRLLFVPLMLAFVFVGCWIGYQVDPPSYSLKQHFFLSALLVSFMGFVGWLTYWACKFD